MGGPPKVPFGFRVSTTRHGGTVTNRRAVGPASGAISFCATADIAVIASPNARRNIIERRLVCINFSTILLVERDLAPPPGYSVLALHRIRNAFSARVAIGQLLRVTADIWAQYPAMQ